MKKLESLQIARAIAVASVLLYHLAGLSAEYQHGLFYYPWTRVLRAGVDVFFVISGVVMIVTTYRRLEQPGTGKRFLIHRLSRIYPPYLFLTLILTVFWIIRPTAVNANSGGVDLLSSYTLWPSAKLPLVQVGWTLSFEMMFYLVFFCIIISVTRAWLSRALILWSVAIVAGCTAIAMDTSGTLLRSFPRAPFFFSPYVLEFVAGCFVGLASLKFSLRGGRWSVFAAVALFALQGAVPKGGVGMVSRVLLFGPPAVLLVYGLLAWEIETGLSRVPRWIVRCGDMSYSIYLVHLLVIHAAYRYAWRAFDYRAARPLFLVFTTGVAIGASVIFYKLVERPFSLWTRLRLEDLLKSPGKIAIAPVAVDPTL